jgi:peptide/nickel transport system substrate-binding protein
MKKSLFISVLLILLIVPLISVTAQDDEAVIISVESDISTLNPILWVDGGSGAAGQWLWPLPFDVDPFTGLPVFGLTTWEISEDGLTYTFTIRDDAVWSDGTPVTAHDAKFTYDAVASDLIESPRKANIAFFDSVNVIDDKTYEVVLTEVNCTIWNDFAAIRWLPAHLFGDDFSDIMDHPLNSEPTVSAGPWILEEWQPDQFQRYVANPTFWRGEPEIPVFIQRPIQDPAVQIQALLAQEVDYGGMYPDEAAQLGNAEFLVQLAYPNFNTPILALNWANPENPMPAFDEEGNPVEQDPHPIFADVRVRQAIAMGYNKDDVLLTLGEGGGFKLIATVLPTLEWAFNTELSPYAYDQETAAALLDEAGWTDADGDGIRECNGCMYAEEGAPLAFTITISPLVDLWENIALIAQDQLGQLGMDISIESVEWGTFINEILLPQQFDALTVGFGGGSPPDPNAITEPILISANDVPGAGFNMTSYVNPRVDELIAAGKVVPGCAVEDRAPIYYEIQEIVQDEVAYDFSVGVNYMYIWNSRVEGTVTGPWDGDAVGSVEAWYFGE